MLFLGCIGGGAFLGVVVASIISPEDVGFFAFAGAFGGLVLLLAGVSAALLVDSSRTARAEYAWCGAQAAQAVTPADSQAVARISRTCFRVVAGSAR